MENQNFRLDLRLFDGGDGAGAAGGAASSSDAGNTRANPLADVVYGKQPTASRRKLRTPLRQPHPSRPQKSRRANRPPLKS